jgi:hypothetical protein
MQSQSAELSNFSVITFKTSPSTALKDLDRVDFSLFNTIILIYILRFGAGDINCLPTVFPH